MPSLGRHIDEDFLQTQLTMRRPRKLQDREKPEELVGRGSIIEDPVESLRTEERMSGD